MNDKISVIIPTYNNENYIAECINSVLRQTYNNYEIIVINDGSADNTLNVIKKIMKKDKCIKLINIKNNGQGYARNLALKQASGDYILFLDSDDILEPVTLEVTIDRIKNDKSDFVYFDWKYYNMNTNRYSYVSKESFFHKNVLVGKECYCLMGIQHYFTVNKLYRKEFLLKNKIFYGEHYIYEDIVFWVKCVLKCKKVSIIQSPLYTVRINSMSTTKTNYNTDKHITGFLKAYDESISLFDDIDKKYKDLFIGYMLKKYLTYYSIRTPKKLKPKLSKEFYRRLKKENIEELTTKSRYIKAAIKLKMFDNYTSFKLFSNAYYKMKNLKKIKKLKNKSKNLLKRLVKPKNYNIEYYKKNSENLKNQILFMGFDYRYTGNSRYLYEEMILNSKYPIYFATNDELVDEKYRVLPESEKFFDILYSSKIVIFESWIPNKLRKPADAIWINLWHGTPLKKMLFDSNEEEIVSVKPSHKKQKYAAIQKMDYLLTDNHNINHYFETSFLFEERRILDYGYPRVKYLIENKNNTKLKNSIREKLKVKDNQKIIAYLPTWRDYNYSDDANLDFNYFLDKSMINKFLKNNNYVLISKDHAYLQKAKNMSITDIETQELLLVCDILITDYSSVMFDAFAIDVPVCILAKDFEKYSLSRGVYDSIWKDLLPFVVFNEDELIEQIKNYKINNEYVNVKNKYCYKSKVDLIAFINNQIKKGDLDDKKS